MLAEDIDQGRFFGKEVSASVNFLLWSPGTPYILDICF